MEIALAEAAARPVESPPASTPALGANATAWDHLWRKLSASRPQSEPLLTALTLDLDEARVLYEKLHRATARNPRTASSRPHEQHPRTDPARMFASLDARLRELPATATESTRVTLEVTPHEAAYLHRIVQNDKRDQARRARVEDRILTPWDERLDGNEPNEQPADAHPFRAPTEGPSAENSLQSDALSRALSELPDELIRLVELLERTDGNVSEAARLLGQPQRKTARMVERLRARLQRAGLAD